MHRIRLLLKRKLPDLVAAIAPCRIISISLKHRRPSCNHPRNQLLQNLNGLFTYQIRV